jgi:hypothetical protein
MHNEASRLIASGSKEELISYMTELCGSIQQTSLKILSLDRVPTIPGFMVTIMGYIATQALRITDWLKEPHLDSIDLIAHSTRGIFETCLIYRDLLRDRCERFMLRLQEEIARDELDIIEGSLSRYDDISDAPEEALARRDELRAINPPRVRHISDRANDTKADHQYRAYYKLLSKYSHPSIYLLVGDRRQVYSQDALRTVAERAIVYLEAATNDYEGLHDSLFAQNAP